MDAFYAAVETLENPSLWGKPMAVGGLSMISTANYEARKFGVRAAMLAMLGFIACKLCPDLIFVPTNFEKYTFYSELTRKVFRRYDPDFISTSLDEAYLNITEVCINRDITSEEVAGELRNAIFEETGLTCSAGVAPNLSYLQGFESFEGHKLTEEHSGSYKDHIGVLQVIRLLGSKVMPTYYKAWL